MNTNINSRIVEFCDKYSIRQIDLVELEISNRQYINKIFKNRIAPSVDFVSKFLTVFSDLDARWLLTGFGKMGALKQPLFLLKSESNLRHQDENTAI